MKYNIPSTIHVYDDGDGDGDGDGDDDDDADVDDADVDDDDDVYDDDGDDGDDDDGDDGDDDMRFIPVQHDCPRKILALLHDKHMARYGSNVPKWGH